MDQRNPTTENYRDDEIDLRKLFQAIGNGFSNLGRWIIGLIVRFRRTTLKYKYLLIVFTLLGVVGGVVLNKMSKPYYKTSMLMSSEYFNSRLIDNSLEKLNGLCQEEDRKGLASVLKIKPEVAKNIRAFDYEPLVSEQDKVDVEVLKQKLGELKVKDQDITLVINQIQIENKDSYIISVEVFDNTIIENLQDALVDYLQGIPYVKNRIKINNENQLKYIAKLQEDIAQLDSLKAAFNLNLKANANRKGETSSNVYVGESGALDPTRVYSQGVTLYRQLQRAQEDVELGSDFELIDGFTVFSRPESPGVLKASVYAAVIFLGIGYLLIMLIEVNKYLNKVEKERFS